MQPALRRHVLRKELHLVSKYAAVGQNQVFCAIWHIGQIQQFHPRFLRRTVAFSLVARTARSHYVHPGVAAAARKRDYVIARKFRSRENATAISAQITV